MRPDADIAACGASHRRLLVALAPLEDGDFRSPSSLPRWSRGHVVTHLANKANALVWLLGGPAEDEIRRQFPTGYDHDLAAEAGASRSAAELRSDLKQSFELGKRLPALPDRADHADLLAWLIGRAPAPDLGPW